MTGLIKARASHEVRRFAERPGMGGAAFVVEAPSLEALRLEALGEEVARLRKELGDAGEAAVRAEAAAHEQGRREAQEAAQQDDEKRLVALGEGIAGARGVWDERLTGLDGLATLVARAAIAKLFDRCDDHSEFVIGMIARQMRHLRRETVLTIWVSAADFPDETSFATIVAGAETGSVTIQCDPQLEAGQCRIDLQLGHIDLCLRSQWNEMAQLLQELTSHEGGA